MPTRASDRVTLAVLPAVTYQRTYYQLAASTASAPAVPATNPPASPWSTTEPAYTAGSTQTLYTVQLIAYGTAAFEYGPVQKSSAYEAAKQAYNLALQANGLPRIERGTAVPTANSPAAPDGSAYFRHQAISGQPVGSGPVLATYARVNGAWVETPIIIRAGQLEAGTVIGLLIQSAAAGQRVEILGNRMDIYSPNGSRVGTVYGGDDPGQAGGFLVLEGAGGGRGLIVGPNSMPPGGNADVAVRGDGPGGMGSLAADRVFAAWMYDYESGTRLPTHGVRLDKRHERTWNGLQAYSPNQRTFLPMQTFVVPPGITGVLRYRSTVTVIPGSTTNRAGYLSVEVDGVIGSEGGGPIGSQRWHTRGANNVLTVTFTDEILLSPGTHQVRGVFSADNAGASFTVSDWIAAYILEY